MKIRIFKHLLLPFVFSIGLFFYSCDDAGLDPNRPKPSKGQVTFTHTNLKPLNPSIDGLYVLWLKIDNVWYDLGHFNVTSSGEITDSLGNTPYTFTFTGDTNSLGNASRTTVTLGYNPTGSVLIAGSLEQKPDSVTADLWTAHELALGEIGKKFIVGYPMAAPGGYMLRSPTTNNSQCSRGIWFCDSLQQPTFSPGLTLQPGNGWLFEGWLNKKTGESYSLGRFYNFYNADQDGAGPCKGPNGNGFNYPGQDFISLTPAPPCVPYASFNNDSFYISVTIEPEFETGAALTSPFYLQLFKRIDVYPACNRVVTLYNQGVYNIMPTGRLKITN